MKLALWNICSGGVNRRAGESRLPDIAVALRAQEPDVIVLNEYRCDASEPLLEELAHDGWKYQAVSPVEPRWGGVAVCSRGPLLMRPMPAGFASMKRRCVVVDIADAGLTLWAVYAPYSGPEVPAFWSAVLDGIALDAGRDALLVGDLNAGITGADMPVGVTLPGNRFVRRLTEAGWRDVWRQQAGEDAEEWTWIGTANPYRVDHAFGSPGAARRVRACGYRHEERLAGVSDHSMLLVELTPRPSAASGSQQ